MIGETVGNFKIVSKLSIGGMGTVYKAEHSLIGKLAAVKILHPELSSNHEIIKRFFNEAKATTTIKHPGIVEIFDYGYMKSGMAYLTMEFLEGMSLARRLKTRGRMGEGEAAMMLRAVCSALHAAHGKGIIHRDLKPDNIFMTPDPDSAIGERPKVLDFGIAKLTDIGLAGTATKTGAVMGTPTYMSPEQCRGTGEVDARADLYSIGCIFYELVTGRPPHNNLGAGELIGAHLYVDPELPTVYNPDLSIDTTKLIMALLRKRADERPQSAKELGQRLYDLAQKLGWITPSSPNGITGPILTELALRARSEYQANAGESGKTAYERPSGKFLTPGGSSVPSLGSLAASLDEAAEKPTTLSGAASQIDLPKRSRKSLGLAMAAAALLAGGSVAFFKLHRTGSAAAASAPAAGGRQPPAAVNTKPVTKALDTPVAPTPVETKPAKPAVGTADLVRPAITPAPTKEQERPASEVPVVVKTAPPVDHKRTNTKKSTTATAKATIAPLTGSSTTPIPIKPPPTEPTSGSSPLIERDID